MREAPTGTRPLIKLRDLSITVGPNALAVRNLNLEIRRGETLALVGESGSGKSLSIKAMLGLLPRGVTAVSGSLDFWPNSASGTPDLSPQEAQNFDLTEVGAALRLRGGHIGLLSQEPGASLDPVRSIGAQLVEVTRTHRRVSKQDARGCVRDHLERLGFDDIDRVVRSYPHELSGGMQQRVGLARALVGEPSLLIADEPTTGQDPVRKEAICSMLVEVRKSHGLAVLLVTHDMSLVERLSDQTAVIYAGSLVEVGRTHQLLEHPLHPYTAGLLQARPEGRVMPSAMPGQVPSPGHSIVGCQFGPRCPHRLAMCGESGFLDKPTPHIGRLVACPPAVSRGGGGPSLDGGPQ